MDLVRRRRWHRKMVQEDPSAPAVFHIDVGSGDDVRITDCIGSKLFVCLNVVKGSFHLIRVYSSIFSLSRLSSSLCHSVSLEVKKAKTCFSRFYILLTTNDLNLWPGCTISFV